MFLAKHPDDQGKIDEFSRWWPEWYTYTNIKDSQEIVYNQRILIRPNACPDSKKHIQWATKVKLTSTPENNKEGYCHIVGPFNSESIDKYNRTQKNSY